MIGQKRVGKAWRIPEELWERVEPLLPKYRRRRKRSGGRPRLELRQVVDGIFYVLRTGCQWKAAPPEFGCGSSLHNYFQDFVRRGVFRKLWKAGLEEYDELYGIHWAWQSIDGAMTKAPLGGEKDGPQPHGSGQTRHQALPAYRRRRRSAQRGRQRRQHA